MYFQLMHIVTSYIVFCISKNVILLADSDNLPENTPENSTLWELTASHSILNAYYICNVNFGTCLGSSLQHPPTEYQPITAEDRELAQDAQLLWIYDPSGSNALHNAENPDLLLGTWYLDKENYQSSGLMFTYYHGEYFKNETFAFLLAQYEN